MLKHQNARTLLGGELDNTRAHQMGHVLITMAQLAPEVGIVLFVFGNDASLRAVACNASEQSLPKARYLSATANEAGSEDGAFDRLDGTHGDVFTQVEIHSADLCFRVADLFYSFGWCAKGLLKGSVQPPLLAMPDKLGTAQLKTGRQIAGQGAHLDPAPARSRPDFERDRVLAPILPLSRIEGSRLIPGPRRDWRALFEGLLLLSRARGSGFVPLFTRLPAFERGEEGAGRAKCCIDGGAAKHGRDIRRDLRKLHDGIGVGLCGMGESFQGCKRLFVFESQNTFMRLDDFKVEGDNTIEEGGILRKVVGMLRLIVQCRSDRAGRLGHVCFLLAPALGPLAQYSIVRTRFQQARAKAEIRLTTVSRTVACGGLKP